MTAETIESGDARRARVLKSEMGEILGQLVDKMEEARQEGFIVSFTIPQQNGTGPFVVSGFTISKSW